VVGLVAILAAASACAPVTLGRAVLGLPTQPSQTQYQDAVRQVWSSNNRMNMTDDASLPDRFETGNAVLGDQAYIAGRKAQGVGPGLQAALPLKSSDVWVPPQNAYPAHFLALVNSLMVRQGVPDRSSPSGYFFELVRSSKNAPWKIDDWTFLANAGHKPPVALDSGGQATYLSGARSTGRFLVDPSRLSPAYEQFFVDTVNHQSYGGPFTEDAWTSGEIQLRGAADQSMSTLGATLDNQVGQAGGTSVWAATGGGAVVFFHLTIVETISATAGKLACVVQAGNGQGNFDYTLAPGSYTKVEFDTLYTLVALDPPKGSSSKVKVLAGYGAVLRATGNPAAPSSCTP
jgi:hypothetical protein